MQQESTFADNLRGSALPLTEPRAAAFSHTHPLQFIGHIGDYFRVWLVNRVLTLVTLGLYKPFARRRTAQYFYEHTLLADSPLEFTAKGRVMMRGFLIGLVLAGVYQLTQMSEQDLIWGLAMLVATLWGPFAWQSAMRFRFANTRWRGLRLNFAVNWRQTYKAYWPLWAQTALGVVMLVTLTHLAPFELDGPLDLGGLIESFFEIEDAPPFTTAMNAVLAGGAVLLLACAITLDYNLRDLVIRRTRFGAQPACWRRPPRRQFVNIWLVTGILWAVGLTLLYLLLAYSLDAAGLNTDEETRAVMRRLLRKHGLMLIVWVFAAVTAFVFTLILFTTLGRAYYRASLFKLVWNRVMLRLDATAGGAASEGAESYASHASHARFSCNLSLPAYLWLRCKNTFLTLLTLGFYTPRATLSEYRMRIASVSVHVPGDLDALTGELARQQGGALGDVIADTLGMELIG